MVTQIKTLELDGYQAVQLGFGTAKHQPKPQQGHLKASGANSRTLREIRVDEICDLKTGTSIDASVFEVGDKVQVTVTSKVGFAGTIKRHNFHRGPRRMVLITIASLARSAPCILSTLKGMRMAGQMGVYPRHRQAP